MERIRRPVNRQEPTIEEADKPASLSPAILSTDYTYFGVTKTQGGGIENAIAFRIKFKDGSQDVIQYHELISPFTYNGSNLIELATTRLFIKIEGKNLEPILDYLQVHRLIWIKEHDNSFPIQNINQPVIESISVETPQ